MKFVAAILILAFSLQANAVVFQRDVLTVLPKPPKVVIDEKTGQPAKEQPEPRASFQFYTELRDEQALQLDWVHSLNRISEQRTMTILFKQPVYDAIYAQNVYQPLDVISINPEGIIVQIVPDLILAELATPIQVQTPVSARLILNGGAAEILELQPGDRIQHPHFRPAPKVMTQ